MEENTETDNKTRRATPIIVGIIVIPILLIMTFFTISFVSKSAYKFIPSSCDYAMYKIYIAITGGDLHTYKAYVDIEKLHDNTILEMVTSAKSDVTRNYILRNEKEIKQSLKEDNFNAIVKASKKDLTLDIYENIDHCFYNMVRNGKVKTDKNVVLFKKKIDKNTYKYVFAFIGNSSYQKNAYQIFTLSKNQDNTWKLVGYTKEKE